IAEGGFLEWTDFLGSYYGTPTPSAPDGVDVVLEIEVDGAQQIRSRHPDALLIFVLPPPREEQKRRLQSRGGPAAEGGRRGARGQVDVGLRGGERPARPDGRRVGGHHRHRTSPPRL